MAVPSAAPDFVGSDRGLKRLGVTPIDAGALQTPPVVSLDDRLAEARRQLGAQAARWAVVLDAQGRLHGSLARDRSEGEGSVRDRAVPMPASVPSHVSLKQAFAALLMNDAGWIGVTEGDRYLGVLTPDGLHAALRRSVAADASG